MAQAEKSKPRGRKTAEKKGRPVFNFEKELHHTLFTESADGVFISDSGGNFLDVNPRGGRMLGYTRREILRMNWRDLIPAEDFKTDPLRTDDLTTGRTAVSKRRLRRRNGSFLSVEMRRGLLSDGRLVSVVQDRSASKAAEETIEMLAQVPIENPNPVIRVDAQGKILFANDASQPLLQTWKTRVGRSLPRVWKTFVEERIRDGSRASVDVNCGERVFSVMFAPIEGAGYVNLYGQDVTEQKQAEHRYRSLFEQSHDAVFIFDLTGRYIRANQRAADMLGFSPAEIQNLSVLDTSGEPEATRAMLKRLLRGEHIPTYERIFRRRDGHTFPAEVDMELVRDAEDRPLHIQSLVRDISKRKMAEDGLRASEVKYRMLIEQLPMVVYLDVLDGKGTSLFVSSQVETILGVTVKEWLESDNQIWLDLIHPDDRQRMSKALGKLTSIGQEYDYEYRVIRRDGRQIWLRDKGAVLQGRSGELMLQGIMFDITQGKDSDLKLAESHSVLEATLEATADGILTVDRENKVGRFNRKFAQMWHIPDEILATRDDGQVLAAALQQMSDPDEFLQKVREVYAHPNSESSDKLTLKDGRVIERLSFPQIMDGEIVGRVWSFRDTTEREEAEQALRDNEFLLRESQAVAELGSYVADISTGTWIGSEIFDQIFGIDENYDHTLAGWAKILHPSDRDMMVDYLLHEVVEKRQPFDKEYRVIRQSDHAERWVHGRGRLEFDDSGRPVKMHGIIQDITEHKLREREREALASVTQALEKGMELDALLQNLLDAAVLAIPSAEKGGIALLTNDDRLTVRAISGYADPDILGFTYPITWGYGGRAFRQGHAELILDVKEDLEFSKGAGMEIPEEVRALRSAIVVPLVVNETSLGVLSLESQHPHAFNEVDVKLLSAFAASASLVIERARLLEEMRQSVEETGVLLSTSRALSNLDLQSVLQTIGERSRSLFAADGCRIFLLEPDGRTLRCVLAVSEDPAAFTDLRINIGEGVTGAVAASGEAEIVDDMEHDPRAVQVPGTDSEPETIMFAPLKERDRTVGVISIRRVGTQRLFQPADLELLKALASMAASAVSNARLFEEAHVQVAELEMIYQSGLALNQLLTPKEIGQKVIELLEQKMEWHNTTIRLYHPETETLELLAFNVPGTNTPAKRRAAEAHLNQAVSKPGEGMCGWALQHSQNVRSGDLENDPRYVRTYPGLNSGLYIPLRLGERNIGVIGIESAVPNAFTDADERLVATLANQAAIALENARLFEETRQRVLEQGIIHQASQSLMAAHLDSQTVYKSMHEAVFQIMPCEAFVIVLVDEVSGDYQAVYLHDGGQNYPPRNIPRGTGLSGKVISEGKSSFIHDNWETNQSVIHFGTEQTVRSILAVPLREDHRIIGMVSAQSYQPDAFNRQHQVLLETLAAQMTTVIQNTRLFEEARRRVAELETVNRISIALRAISNQEEMLAVVLAELLAALKITAGTISLWNEQTGRLHYSAARGWLSEFSEAPFKPDKGMIGNVFSSGSMYVSRDFRNDPITLPESRDRLPAGWGGACVPIHTTDKVLGILIVAVPSERELSRDEIRLLNTLAEMTGNALQRMRLHEETQQRAEEFESLYQTMTAISGEHNLSDLLQAIVNSATDLLDAGGGGMYLHNPATDELEMVVSTHASLPIGIRMRVGEGLAGLVAQNRQPMRLDDYSKWEHRISAFQNTPIRAVLEVPMLHSGELIGVLVAEEVGDIRRTYSDRDERLLSLFASQAAGAIRSARLREETDRRLQNLQALREVDRVIASLFDLHPILNTVLSHTVTQLGVDAANVLILNPVLQTLEFAAGLGFRTRGIERIKLRLGEGQAGRAALERRVVHVPSLPEAGSDFSQAFLLSGENFLEYYGVPLVSKGEIKGILGVFHRSRLPTGSEWLDLLETLAGQIAIAIDNAQLFENIQRSNMELGLAYDATIEGWSRAMDLRDQETEGHTQRVTSKAVKLALAMGLKDDEITHLRRGALLHDIGKIGIPDNILLKSGELTDAEWVIMRKHPTFAAEMLRSIAYLRNSLDIPYLHHERWDGSGYPLGLTGEQIPLSARIFAVVDVYDALTSDRPYRKAWSKAEARNYLRENGGKLFDPAVVEIFLEMSRDEAG